MVQCVENAQRTALAVVPAANEATVTYSSPPTVGRLSGGVASHVRMIGDK